MTCRLLFMLKIETTTRGTNSMPFLVFRRDHMRSTSGIICGSGSFADLFGDHLRSGDYLRSGIICGAVQIISWTKYQAVVNETTGTWNSAKTTAYSLHWKIKDIFADWQSIPQLSQTRTSWWPCGSSASTWREILDFGSEGSHVQPNHYSQPLTSMCAVDSLYPGSRDL